MAPLDFILLVFDHLTLITVLSLALPLLLYLATYKTAGGLFDPFHFFYSFTYGTAYAVVALLACTGHIGIMEISIVAGYGLLFLIGYLFFSRVSFGKLWPRKTVLSLGGKTTFLLALFLYLVVAAIFLKDVGFAAFLPSRFQIGRYNLLALIMDPLRLFIAAYVTLLIIRCSGANKRLKRVLLSCIGLIFIVLSSLINGSKVSFLESAYAGLVAVAVSGVEIPWKKAIKPILLVLTIATAYAVGQQYLNLQASGGTENQPGYDMYSKGPLLLDLFAMRIVNNGDIYYYALPAPVFSNIVIDHPFALLFGDIFGGKLLGSLFAIDMDQSVDIGHQTMGYWYGNYHGDVGPTDHFDLDAYKFFGPLGGIVFVLCLAFIVSSVSRLKKGRYDIAGCSAVAAVYMRSLVILLSPHVGLAYLEESVVLFVFLAILAKLLNYAAGRPRTLIPEKLGSTA